MEGQEHRAAIAAANINAQRKGGAGGSYTWGSPLDVQDYEPVGVIEGNVVTAAPAVVAAPVVMAAPFVMEQQAFPTLGSGTTMMTMPKATAGRSYASAVVAAPTVVSNVASVRTGGYQVGQQHPRNIFSKQPNTRPVGTTIQLQSDLGVQMAGQVEPGVQLIDWSKTGMPQAVMQAIVQSPNAAAHLGPYQTQAAPAVALSTLRAQNVGTQAQFQNYAPAMSKHVAGGNQPQIRQVAGTIKQPRGFC